jgi:hypothetical protein
VRAATAYYLRLLLARQGALAPVVAFMSVVAMVYASAAGPALSAGSVTAVALMPASAWLMRLVAGVESGTFAQVTLVALGSRRRRLMARVLATVVVVAALSVAAVVWAMVTNPQPYPLGVVVALLALHLAEGVAGVGLGALVSPPLATRPGPAVTVVVGYVIVALITPWLPPLRPVLQTLQHVTDPSATVLLLLVVPALAFGVVLVGAALVLEIRRARE